MFDLFAPVLYTATVLSVLGSFFTIFTYILFPDSRTTSQIFAVWLAVGSIGFSVPSFLRGDANEEKSVCVLSAAILSYFSLTTLFTAAIVARSIKSIFNAFQSSTRPKFDIEWWHWIVVWVFPLFLTALPFTTNSYGENKDDKFCLIRTDFESGKKDIWGEIWEALILYLIVFAVVIYITFVYRSISRRLETWKVCVLRD